MTKKRLFLIASLPVAVAVIVGALAMLPPRPGVTWANYDRIEKGMTKTDVERLFGGPGTGKLDQVDHIKLYMMGKSNWFQDEAGKNILAWESGDGVVAAATWTSPEGIIEKAWLIPEETTMLDKIRRWLHLR